MYLVTHVKTTTVRNEDGKLEQVRKVDGAHVEYDVSHQLESMALGDDRMVGVRVFNMGVDDAGKPKIGTEVKP